MQDYSQSAAARTEYRDKCKARIKRQLKIDGRDYMYEDVEKMIEDEQLAQIVFTHGIFQQTQQAKQLLADIEARQDDIVKLEMSIVELREMFLVMADLMENQGEMVDRIETHAAQAEEAVDKAVEQVLHARELKRSAKGKRFPTAMILTLIIFFLCLIIYFTFAL